MNYKAKINILLILLIIIFQCTCKKKGCTDPNACNYNSDAQKDDGSCIECNDNKYVYNPTYIQLNVPEPLLSKLGAPVIPTDNPMTVQGIKLGKKLFFDKILSGDNTQSCASCHFQSAAFSDTNHFSIGIDGIVGVVNSMPIFNLAYSNKFFWNGRENSLENQAFNPVRSAIEMHENWKNAVMELKAIEEYNKLFFEAFGTLNYDSTHVVKAIAQFERTIFSNNSKFDKYIRGEVQLTPDELAGYDIFMNEAKGDCFHCHGDINNILMTDNIFHNNGLDNNPQAGLMATTQNPNDKGKFKTPSLRNLAFTAPYMHDSRFNTLQEVINHYSFGLKNSSTIDPLMKKVNDGGVALTPIEQQQLLDFLNTLNDYYLIQNNSLIQ